MQPFPRSKRYVRLSTHTAFQFNSATGRLQASGWEHPPQGAPVEAQHNLLHGVPRYAGEQGTIPSSVICFPWFTCYSSVRLSLPWRTFTLSFPLQESIGREVGGQVLIAQEHQPPPPEPDVRLVTASGSHEISYALLGGMGCMPDQKDVFRRNRHHGFSDGMWYRQEFVCGSLLVEFY